MTTSDAGAVLLVYHVYEGEPGGVLIVDTPQGLKVHYTPNPGNMAGRMVLIETLEPLSPANLSDPAELAKAVNAALDDAEALAEDEADDRRYMAEMQPEAMKDTGRTYETTTLALELANVEPLYTAAREACKDARQFNEENADLPERMYADALKEYVESIMEDQDTRNPQTALLVALAIAATCRVDWQDVAEQISEDL